MGNGEKKNDWWVQLFRRYERALVIRSGGDDWEIPSHRLKTVASIVSCIAWKPGFRDKSITIVEKRVTLRHGDINVGRGAASTAGDDVIGKRGCAYYQWDTEPPHLYRCGPPTLSSPTQRSLRWWTRAVQGTLYVMTGVSQASVVDDNLYPRKARCKS